MGTDDDFLPDDDGERTAVVNLMDLKGLQRPARDRHLLVRVQGTNLGQVIRLDASPRHIGRSQDSEIWLSDDGVSRRHALISWDKTHYVIEDLNSANGTFVHGQPVTRHALKDGELIQLGSSAVFRYSVTDADQEALLRQLYDASVTDSLTGAANREHFETQLANELSYSRRHRTELSLVLFDLDHFKHVNDTYGHPAGDSVLVAVTRQVRGELRAEDVFARYGGEEFVVVLRGIDIVGAAALADRLRARVAALTVRHDSAEIRVTLSAGCASVSELPEARAEALIGAADRRLYLAKHNGRNRVVASG